MIANYIKIAFRNILKYKIYSFLNIIGLASGMVCCIFLAICIHFNLNFAKYHTNKVYHHSAVNLHSIIGKHKFIDSFFYLYIIAAITLFILLIIFVNFMNMSMANFFNRSQEMDMRKVLGAGRRELIIQSLVQSLLFSFLAMIIALVLIECLLPFSNSLTGQPLNYNFAEIPWLLPGIIFLALFMGFISIVSLFLKKNVK